MKFLLAHNHYQQSGGEDQVFAAEGALLESYGHQVMRYTVHNEAVENLSKLALAKATVWNSARYRELCKLFRREKLDVVHVHNTLPLISPAVYYAAKVEGIPVVQTLHNYRFSCVNGLFFRDGRVCEDCLAKLVPWSGVMHKCFRESRAASSVVAAMLAFHKLRRTYCDMVDLYIGLTKFSRWKFIQAGLPADKVVVKPNFVAPDPGVGSGRGGYALFLGRLSKEKGLHTMLSAWRQLGGRLPLKIVGDGPLADEVQRSSVAGVKWLGRETPAKVYELLGEAMVLIFPSECYETFGLVAVEAFAKGTPIIAANIGAIAELAEHGPTGLYFTPGNADELAAQAEWALAHPTDLAQMRLAARAEYEAKYTAERNYQLLMDIYERARSGAS